MMMVNVSFINPNLCVLFSTTIPMPGIPFVFMTLPFFFFKRRRGRGGRAEGKAERESQSRLLSVEPDSGLNLTTPRS